MKVAQVVVDGTFESCGRGYVVAHLLDPVAGFASPATALGGYPIDEWLDMPRVLDGGGCQRTDVLGFCLRNLADRTRLKPGDRVALT
jgi:hypothetical protein